MGGVLRWAHRAFVLLLPAACSYPPLPVVDVLPADAVIPSVTSNGDLLNQIILNDTGLLRNKSILHGSLGTTTLMQNNNIIVRGTGMAASAAGDGVVVKFWPFGAATRAPNPLYQFGRGDRESTSLTQL